MRRAAMLGFFAFQAGLAAAPMGAQAAQDQQTSALIERIHRADSPDGAGPSMRACALDEDLISYDAAVALARLGTAALAPIREALSVEPWRPNSSWLLYAYARIRGSDAFDELLSSASIQPAGRRSSYLAAAAIARGFTSVVGSMQDVTLSHRGRVIVCNALEPRHTLDLFLLSVLRGDREMLGRSLGPSGRAQLSTLPDEAVFPKSRRAPAGQYFSYKMETGDAWLELRPEHSHEALRAEEVGAKRDLRVEFVTRQGAPCLHRTLRFEAFPADSESAIRHVGAVEYRMEPEQLLRLLDEVRGCAW